MSADLSGQSSSAAPAAAIIANPASGRGHGRASARRARRYLRDHGLETPIYWTSQAGEATDLARRLLQKGVQRIAGCGGDGTLNEIANALAGSEGVLGVIPAGRGNDLCRALGIPCNPVQAADVFLYGRTRTIDLGRIGSRFFNTIATLGFDAEVCRTAAETHLPFSGPTTYLCAVLKTLWGYEPPRVRITGDSDAYEGRIFLAATANSPMYGGGMNIAPPARMDDGLLHVCLIEEITRWKVFQLLPQVYSGDHLRHPFVRIFSTRQLRVESRQPTWLYADGERMAETPVTIQVVPKTLKVMTPLPLHPDGSSENLPGH